MPDSITAPAEGGSFSRIPLSGRRGAGKFTKVSPHRFKYLSQFKWHLVADDYVARVGTNDGKRMLIYLHREIMGFPEGKDVDHKNGDHLDNRDSNLRPATRAQNNCNAQKRRASRHSRYRGVTWCAYKRRWVAQINYNGQHVLVGYFKIEDEAARARDGAALALHGEFAVRSAPHLEPIPYVPPSPVVKTSSRPGVGWAKSKRKWRAFTTINGKYKHLGYFNSEEEAYETYREFLQR